MLRAYDLAEPLRIRIENRDVEIEGSKIKEREIRWIED